MLQSLHPFKWELLINNNTLEYLVNYNVHNRYCDTRYNYIERLICVIGNSGQQICQFFRYRDISEIYIIYNENPQYKNVVVSYLTLKCMGKE